MINIKFALKDSQLSRWLPQFGFSHLKLNHVAHLFMYQPNSSVVRGLGRFPVASYSLPSNKPPIVHFILKSCLIRCEQ